MMLRYKSFIVFHVPKQHFYLTFAKPDRMTDNDSITAMPSWFVQCHSRAARRITPLATACSVGSKRNCFILAAGKPSQSSSLSARLIPTFDGTTNSASNYHWDHSARSSIAEVSALASKSVQICIRIPLCTYPAQFWVEINTFGQTGAPLGAG
jgi:hypothetical protein